MEQKDRARFGLLIAAITDIVIGISLYLFGVSGDQLVVKLAGGFVIFGGFVVLMIRKIKYPSKPKRLSTGEPPKYIF